MLRKAWRRLRKIFSKKETRSTGVGTVLTIPEHCQTENVFTFVVANRLSEAVAERDTLKREKDELEVELKIARETADQAHKEIDELKRKLAWMKDLVETTIDVAGLDTLCDCSGDKDRGHGNKDSTNTDSDAAMTESGTPPCES